MDLGKYLLVSSCVFGLAATMHLLRVIMGVSITFVIMGSAYWGICIVVCRVEPNELAGPYSSAKRSREVMSPRSTHRKF